MNGNSVALDTNVAVHVLNGVPSAIQFLSGYGELCLPVPVVGELRYGALNSARSLPNLEKVEKLLLRCRPLLVDTSTAEVYARVRSDLKRKGTPIPENDVWIAAVCIQHDLPLATEDHHFSRVANLKTVRP